LKDREEKKQDGQLFHTKKFKTEDNEEAFKGADDN
jgi:hypothetical protein